MMQQFTEISAVDYYDVITESQRCGCMSSLQLKRLSFNLQTFFCMGSHW